MRRSRAAVAALVSVLAAGAGKPPGGRRSRQPVPLAEKSIDEILAQYTFVGDFDQKDAERPVSDEVFWRYPLQLPKATFPIQLDLADAKQELPATRGEGRAVDHLNRGRIAYLEGRYAEAKGVWLGARARFGKNYPFHRRDDYFIALAFMKLAKQVEEAKAEKDWEDLARSNYSNAATFLSWAFIMKADQPDALAEAVTPKQLYNLAAIYWKYGRYAGAFGAADTGLNFLRKTGRKEYRSEFHRFSAEAHIRNRDYLEAVQELDTAIRQDPDPKRAALAFARAGDIYFDLNNYDLAEDAYALGAKIDEDLHLINPEQLVMRGESLFWLGRFSEAQRILHFALEGSAYRDDKDHELPLDTASWAALRIADAYLARKELDKARLEYYKVGHDWPSALAGRIAKARSACLELPYYQGHNVQHARDLLEEAKAEVDFPAVARELAWACQVGSYTERERTPEMLERVRAFAAVYPESGFLKSFVTPVREFQAAKIEPYFKAGEPYRALSFFEKNRKALFPRISPELGAQLFAAYADVHKAEAAAEFWDAYAKTPDSDLKVLRQAVVAGEMLAAKKAPKGSLWAARNAAFAKTLQRRAWHAKPDRLPVSYLDRMMETPGADAHLRWMQALAQHFGAEDGTMVCDLEYPLLSRMNAKADTYKSLVEKRVAELIDQELPELFRHDESCGLSLLELEATRLRSDPAALAQRYLKRKDWPLVAGFLHLYWTISEHVYDAGEKAGARQLWEVIRDKGPPDSPEVEFAKARLDPSRTEFEKLWD